MIKLRSLAIAYIKNENKFLLMKRAENRKFAPGLWATVGGHIDKTEINDPQIACLREIEEETGFLENDITNLEIKYIVIRKCDLEIRIQYVYFCVTEKMDVKKTPEGELFWVEESELFNRELSFTTSETLKRYLTNRNIESSIMVGIVNESNGKPVMNWSHLNDWDKNRFY